MYKNFAQITWICSQHQSCWWPVAVRYSRICSHTGGKVQVPHTWWRHEMETFSALLAICAGNSPLPGEVPAQRPVKRSFDIFFDLRLDKRLSKKSWGWWFETPSRSLWRNRNDIQDRDLNDWFGYWTNLIVNGFFLTHPYVAMSRMCDTFDDTENSAGINHLYLKSHPG